jgi:hypothetical protein
MKPRKSKFTEIKGLLNPMRITYYPFYKDIPHQNTDQIVDTDSGKYLLCIVKRFEGVFYPIPIDDMFSRVRDEVISNISMPIEKDEKILYLNEIIDFYSEVDDNIVEDNEGQLSSNIHLFIKHHSQMELYPDEYTELLDKLKNGIRNEISFLDNQNQQLIKNYNYSRVVNEIPYNLKWDKNKVDLVELFAALVESESILKDNLPVTKEFMAEFLSKIFTNIDLADFAKDLDQAKKRKKNKTPYLNFLAKRFVEFANKKHNQ